MKLKIYPFNSWGRAFRLFGSAFRKLSKPNIAFCLSIFMGLASANSVEAQFTPTTCNSATTETTFNSPCAYIVTISMSKGTSTTAGVDSWKLVLPSGFTATPSCGTIPAANYEIGTLIKGTCGGLPPVEVAIEVQERSGACPGGSSLGSCTLIQGFPPVNPLNANTDIGSITENSMTDLGGGNCEYEMTLNMLAGSSSIDGKWELDLPAGVTASNNCGDIPNGAHPVPYTINTTLTMGCGTSTDIGVKEYDLNASCPTSYPDHISGWANSSFSGSALPVELVSFQGRLKNEQVELDWETASETDNEGFEIQRSADGREWQPIGFVAGAGTVLQPRQYIFSDKKPLVGMNYYRFQQMDFDGQSEFSNVISVKNGGQAEALRLSPNPVRNGRLTLHLPQANEQPMDCTVFNQFGSKVRSAHLAPGDRELNVGGLPTGLYTLNIHSGLFPHTQNFMVVE